MTATDTIRIIKWLLLITISPAGVAHADFRFSDTRLSHLAYLSSHIVVADIQSAKTPDKQWRYFEVKVLHGYKGPTSDSTLLLAVEQPLSSSAGWAQAKRAASVEVGGRYLLFLEKDENGVFRPLTASGPYRGSEDSVLQVGDESSLAMLKSLHQNETGPQANTKKRLFEIFSDALTGSQKPEHSQEVGKLVKDLSNGYAQVQIDGRPVVLLD